MNTTTMHNIPTLQEELHYNHNDLMVREQQEAEWGSNDNLFLLQAKIRSAISRINALPSFNNELAITVPAWREEEVLIRVDPNGYSPLHFAAAGDFDLAVLLVSIFGFIGRKDFLATVDKQGKTPLHWAVYARSVEMVKLLIQGGAPLNVQDFEGWTPLHYATASIFNAKDEDEKRNCRALLSFLIASLADLNIMDFSGITALHLAAEAGDVETVRGLIQNGASVHVKDYQGENPLFYAIRGGHMDLIKILVQEFAVDMDNPNDDEESVLDVCKSIGDQSMTDLVDSLINSRSCSFGRWDTKVHSLEQSNGFLSLSDQKLFVAYGSSGCIGFSGHTSP